VKKELPFLVTKAKMPSFNTLIFPILWHQNLKIIEVKELLILRSKNIYLKKYRNYSE